MVLYLCNTLFNERYAVERSEQESNFLHEKIIDIAYGIFSLIPLVGVVVQHYEEKNIFDKVYKAEKLSSDIVKVASEEHFYLNRRKGRAMFLDSMAVLLGLECAVTGYLLGETIIINPCTGLIIAAILALDLFLRLFTMHFYVEEGFDYELEKREAAV